MRSRHQSGFATITIILGVLLALALATAVYFAYQAHKTGTSHPVVSPSPTDSASSTPTASPSPTSAPTPTATATPVATTTPAITECTTTDLTASIAPGSGAAGTSYESLVLTNRSSHSCIIQGYPGVALINAAGATLGQPAARNAVEAPTAITLASGQAAYATLGFPNPGNFDADQCSTAATALRIYPPDQTTALTTPATQAYCPGFFVAALSTSQQ